MKNTVPIWQQQAFFKWIVELNQKTRQYWSKDNQLLYIENVVMPL